MRNKNTLVCGVGINDADYEVYWRLNGKKMVCPYYRRWSSMLRRCYSSKVHETYPSYLNCSVCDEWKYFMTFRAWMVEQDWQGMHLDKDIILVGNKVYCPQYCAFVSKLTNLFTVDAGTARGEWPTGVHWSRKSKIFIASICNQHTKRTEKLGKFLSPDQAHLAWKKRKHELALQLADLQTDRRIVEALRTRYLK